jgi:hypothetical protein
MHGWKPLPLYLVDNSPLVGCRLVTSLKHGKELGPNGHGEVEAVRTTAAETPSQLPGSCARRRQRLDSTSSSFTAVDRAWGLVWLIRGSQTFIHGVPITATIIPIL